MRALALCSCLALTVVLYPALAEGQQRVTLALGGGAVTRGLTADLRGGHGFGSVSMSLAPSLAVRGSATLAVGRFANSLDLGLAPLETAASIDLAAVLRWPRTGVQPYVAFGTGYSSPSFGRVSASRTGLDASLGLGISSSSGRGWFAEATWREGISHMAFFTLGHSW